jgi:hypothetical protein
VRAHGLELPLERARDVDDLVVVVAMINHTSRTRWGASPAARCAG